MIIRDLGSDLGLSLTLEIINSNYTYIPNKIILDYDGQLRKFGGICPKLKAIILHYNILTAIKEQ